MSLHHEIIRSDRENNPPLFLIHTLPLDSTYLKNSLKKISIDTTLILIDLPSHGKSEDVDHENINFNFFTEAINSLREDLNLDTISIYGHGIGGFIAMSFAIKYKNNIHKLIVSNTAVSSGYRTQMAWNIRSQYSNLTKDVLARAQGKLDDKSIRMRFTNSLSTHFHPKNQKKANDLLDNANRIASEPYVLISHYHIPKYNIRERIRSLDKPTLILGGAYDVWPVEEIKKIKIDIPHGKLHFFPSGHFPMIDLPKKYWNVIFNWLRLDKK